MALTPQPNEAFLREVDEELRKDQAVALWKRWGKIAIAVVLAALAALAGWLWWQQHRVNVAGEQGERFNQAIDALGADQDAKAQPILADLAKSGTQGYAVMAAFTEADLLLKKDDLKGAAAKFAGIAGDTGVAQPLRDLALVRQTSAEYDTLQPQVVIDRLRPLAVKGQPWFGSAGEMTAVAHLRMGRRDLAGRMFGEIAADEQVPQSIRQRAVQMAGVLGVDAVDQSGEKKAG
ncbi:tetratricopeptide repeat protein [Sphingomonas donggukensis]|uniref:Tetratricopeptide repeat protein n=1 Tax=Sphingomonas donggukensis TaxID=2949093 RepID=A0ABY4TV42_9SPHN|nr:tetratricopeptide repeat protein [Sphingomonas donggukensis]URW76162.1 tetratricopeptide repeat protein [Sphingomonas donggukensis]